MNLLDSRSDIRVAHYRFMTGLQRINAVNLFYPNITRDEMDRIAYELTNIKSSIRNSHAKRVSSPIDQSPLTYGNNRNRRDIHAIETEYGCDVYSKLIIPVIILIIFMFLIPKAQRKCRK